MLDAELEILDEPECLSLIAAGGIGRLVFAGRWDLTVLPVNYRVHDGTILFRTAQNSATDQDLRTGIADAEYRVAFEVDDFDSEAREGWSVLIQGPAHHLDTDEERRQALEAGVEPWPGGLREHFIQIRPSRITGRRITRHPAMQSDQVR
jgi:nitroimidazol reductase NimA-like FMN-containing flavoprotein (pyridoxamine 5'-phosphate oxidase superfamily)